MLDKKKIVSDFYICYLYQNKINEKDNENCIIYVYMEYYISKQRRAILILRTHFPVIK